MEKTELYIICPKGHKLYRKDIKGFSKLTDLPIYYCKKCFSYYGENNLWEYNDV